MPKACLPCRSAKRRCVQTGIGRACSACITRKTDCDLTLKPNDQKRHSSRALRAKELPPDKGGPRDRLGRVGFEGESQIHQANSYGPQHQQEHLANAGLHLSATTAIELVEHYLEKIHNRPHSLFHPRKLIRDVRSGRINRALLLAICSIGCRFSSDREVRLLESQLTAESKRLLQSDIENICLENIQTCILVANLSGAESNPSAEALYFRKMTPVCLGDPSRAEPGWALSSGTLTYSCLVPVLGIANDMAQIMNMTTSTSSGPVVLREMRTRTWWTLFMADRWCSFGLGLPRQLKDFDQAVSLPMDESVFHSLDPDQQSLTRPWKPGLWAHMITLVQLFGPIQDLNRRSVQDEVDEEEIARLVDSLAQSLQDWERVLPSQVKFTEANLRAHKVKGVGGPFVALHLGFYHYSTLLYFQFLESRNTPTPKTQMYVERCKYYASSYSALLKLARQEGGCEAVWPTVGHMATVSSSVLLHTLLFGETLDLPRARNSLNSNFEALVELKNFWPSLATTVRAVSHGAAPSPLVSKHLS